MMDVAGIREEIIEESKRRVLENIESMFGTQESVRIYCNSGDVEDFYETMLQKVGYKEHDQLYENGELGRGYTVEVSEQETGIQGFYEIIIKSKDSSESAAITFNPKVLRDGLGCISIVYCKYKETTEDSPLSQLIKWIYNKAIDKGYQICED